MGIGNNNLHKYIKTASFRGIAVDYRKIVKEKFGLGLDLGWNVFSEVKTFDTYIIHNTTYSGKQYRYSNHFPIMLATDLYLNQGKVFNPFFGIGIGTMHSVHNIDMNFYNFKIDAWQFALRPELGFIFELDYGIGLLVCSKYYYGFGTKNMKGQAYCTFNIGIALQP